MSTLISASTNPLPGSGVPSEIVFIPEGRSRITPTSHPKGVDVNLPREQGEQIAAALDRQLQEARGGNVLPWFDFEHTRKFPAAGYPTSFRYQAGEGIMCSVEWSGSGRRAIEARDVRHFSPEFYIDENGVPNGFPTRGPIGGLVAEPAFREMRAVAAGAADSAESDSFEGKARALVAAGEVADFDEALARVAATDGGAYLQYLAGLQAAAKPVRISAVEARQQYPDVMTTINCRAELLVASGAVRNLDEGILQAVEADPGLYEAYDVLVRANDRSVRPDTLEKLEQRREEMEPTAFDRLAEVARGIKQDSPDIDDDEALLRACEQNPLLYQEWQDGLPWS